MQEAKPGNKVGVRYKGWLAKNNQVFDQTKGSKTFNFRVGEFLTFLLYLDDMLALRFAMLMACKGWLARYEQGLKQTKGNKTFNLPVGAITRLYLVVLINCLTRGIAQVAGGFQRMIGTLFHTGIPIL